MKAASFSTVLFTQVFQRYNYEQTFVNDMHACQADSSPDASILLSSFSKTHAMAGVTEVMLCLLEQSLIAVCMKGNQAASRELKLCE